MNEYGVRINKLARSSIIWHWESLMKFSVSILSERNADEKMFKYYAQ